ncbi:MAG: hypothetical protein AAGG75_08910, partial [Bacteroidota bacterium]
NVLNVWNLFIDFAHSAKKKFKRKKKTSKIYDKIFFGNNLPSITPKDKEYIPSWTAEEIELLVKKLNKGFLILEKNHLKVDSFSS